MKIITYSAIFKYKDRDHQTLLCHYDTYEQAALNKGRFLGGYDDGSEFIGVETHEIEVDYEQKLEQIRKDIEKEGFCKIITFGSKEFKKLFQMVAKDLDCFIYKGSDHFDDFYIITKSLEDAKKTFSKW